MSKLKGRSQHPGRTGRSLRPDHHAPAKPMGRGDTNASSSAPGDRPSIEPSVPPPSVAASDAIAAEIRAKLAETAAEPEKKAAEPDAPAAEAKAASKAEARASTPPKAEEPARAPKPAAKSSRPPEKKAAPKPAPRPEPDDDDEDDEPSHSLSAAFFHRDNDSVPPHVDEFHDLEHDDRRLHLLSPEALERRARFRRIVAAVVGFAGVVSIAVVGRAVMSHPRPPLAPPPVVTVAAPPPVVAPPPVATATPAPAPEPPPSAAVEAPKASAAPSASAPEPVASAKAEPEKKDDAPKGDGDPVALRKEALKLLNMGKTKDAIPIARAAIAADPSDATAYLYLGSALQDSGKWKDGIEIYCDCVRTATKGPVAECRQMGGHK